MKLASIVIVTFNRLKFTRLTLEAILNNTQYPNYELIILDNHSTDGTIEYLQHLKSQFPQITTIIYQEQNIGKGKAANMGFSIAKGQYIIGMDNDVIVPPNWLTEMVHALNTVPNIGWLCINLSNLGNDYFSPQYERRFGNIVIQETPGVGGQCVAMNRSVYDRLGGYYDDIYYGLEDAEYNVRFRQEGLLTGYLMNVIGYHLGGTPEEREEFPIYQQYKFDTIAAIQKGDFTLAKTNIDVISQSQPVKPSISSEQINSPEFRLDCSLIKGTTPAVYLLYDGYKFEFPSEELFQNLNFSWNDVKIIEQEFIDSIPCGEPLFF